MIRRAISWQVVLLLILTTLVTVRWYLPVTSGLRVEYATTERRLGVQPAGVSGVSTHEVAIAWNREPPDAFSVRWSGYLIVPSDGSYTFSLTSDDGSTLTIDETMVVDNSGNHAAETRSGQIALDRGPHAVVIDYHQASGSYEIEWQWARDSNAAEPVPMTALSPYRLSYGATRLRAWIDAVFVPALVGCGVLIIWMAFPTRSRWGTSSV